MIANTEEKSIQSYPSPEFLNSLSFIKKFYPAPRWGEGKFTKVTHDNSCNLRHSEAHSQSAEWLQKTRLSAGLFCNYLARLTRMRILQAKESSNTNLIQLQGKKNSLTETNLFTHSPIHLFTLKRVTFTLAEGATYVAHCNKSRRVAFTLAEVLITLGIIGVVAAITMPSLVQNYKEKELTTRTKKVFSSIQNASILGQQDSNSIGDNGSLFNRDDGYLKVTENFAKYFDGAKVCKRYSDCPQYYYAIKYSDYRYNSSGEDMSGNISYQPRIILKDSSILYLAELIPSCDNVSVDVTYDSNGRPTSFVNHREYCALIAFDVNGVKSPNQYGIDAFMAVIYKDKVTPSNWNKAGGETLTNILSGKEKLHAKRN